MLRGGLLLSYGLHREAGEIFAQLIEKGARAAGARPRLVLPRQDPLPARLPRRSRGRDRPHRADTLPPDLEEERALLHANLLMARNDYAAATVVLNTLRREQQGAGLYARYNLGVALVRSGDTQRGSALLDELGQAAGDERRAAQPARQGQRRARLRRAADKRPEQARAVPRARAPDGPAVEQGVARLRLGRGRAEGRRSRRSCRGPSWPSATRATRRCSKRASPCPTRTPNCGAYGQALDALQRRDRGLRSARAAKLDESIAAIRAGKLVDGLLEHNPGEEMGWFWSIGRAARDAACRPPVAGAGAARVPGSVQELPRPAVPRRATCSDWHDNLGVFGDMLDNRRKAYAERLPQVRAKAREIDIWRAAEAPRRARRRARAGARRRPTAPRSPTRSERDLLARLAQRAGDAAAARRRPDAGAARERARLAAGALTWELAQRSSDAHLGGEEGTARRSTPDSTEARRRDAALAQAQRDEPARFEALRRAHRRTATRASRR